MAATNGGQSTRFLALAPANAPILDALRVAAAVLVLLSHARNLFFVDFSQLQNPNPLLKLLYYWSGFGHEAVIIFFVLSGFLIGRKVWAQAKAAHWSWSRYLVERLSRLLIVLWPALALTYFWDSLGQSLFGLADIYGGDKLGGNVIEGSIDALSTSKIYLSNAFFLQTILTPAAGSNSALWSLANEFWYYLAFPCLALAVGPRVDIRTRVFHALGFAVFLYYFRIGFVLAFGIWCLGFVASSVAPRIRFHGIMPPVFQAFALFSLLGTFYFSRTGRFPSTEIQECCIGIGTMFFLMAFSQSGISPRVSRVTHFFSDFSYTLYLTHLPFLVFLRAAFVREARWQPDAQGIALGLGITALALAWAWGVYLLTERHTPRIRKFLLARLVRSAPRVPISVHVDRKRA